MNGKQDGECIFCKWYEPEEHTCTNKAGFYYKRHDFWAGDTGCDMWKPCEQYAAELRSMKELKKPLANDYVPNPWREWERKAYLKGSMHE